MITADSLFASLLGASMRAAAIIAILLLLRAPLRRLLGSPCVSLLWLIVLVRLALPWSIESQWSAFNLWPRTVQHQPAAATDWQTRVTVTEGTGVTGAAVQPKIKAATPMQSTPTSLRAWLPMIWLFGASLALVHLGWRTLRTMQLGRKTMPATDANLLAAFASIPTHLRGSVELRELDALAVPALVGWWRPQIWIPRAWLERFDVPELRQILLHELGHARRGDIVVQWLFAFAQCVHWFNPAVWLAARLAQSDRELACDAWVLQRAEPSDAEGYGATLVKAASLLNRPWRGAPAAIAMAASKTHLFERVRGIGQFRPGSAWRAAVGALVFGSALAALVTDRVNAQTPAAPPVAPNPVAPAPAATPVPSTPNPGGEVAPVSPAPDAPAPTAQTSHPQIEVESKFLEIPESALKQLGLDNIGPTPNGSATVTFSDSNKVQALLDRINALGKTVELISAPRLTTKSGARATVEVIREFRYASKFVRDRDFPDGLMPTAWETRNLGATLNVEPIVGFDNKTIDLGLEPQVVELVGFTRIRDGKPIPLGDRMFATTLPKDAAVQPLFYERKLRTDVSIFSGQSVLLGGLKKTFKQASAEGSKDQSFFLFVLVTARVVTNR